VWKLQISLPSKQVSERKRVLPKIQIRLETFAWSRTRPYSLSFSLTHINTTLSLAHTHHMNSLTQMHRHTHTLHLWQSFSLIFTQTHSLSLSFFLLHTMTLTFSFHLSLSHTHTHTRVYTLNPVTFSLHLCSGKAVWQNWDNKHAHGSNSCLGEISRKKCQSKVNADFKLLINRKVMQRFWWKVNSEWVKCNILYIEVQKIDNQKIPKCFSTGSFIWAVFLDLKKVTSVFEELIQSRVKSKFI